MTYDSCRLCGNNHVTPVLELDRVPCNVQRLTTQPVDKEKAITDFIVYQCNDCGLVQAPLRLEEDYYDDYLMATTFSEQLIDYLDNLVEEVVTTYKLQDAKVLDVGCGNGPFMRPFQQRGISVEGIEPSETGYKASIENGYTVYKGFMAADTILPGAPYDAFVSRQVFEHIPDLKGAITGLHNNLKPGAIGIIEIPRLEKALQDLRFYDFFPDHVNYFSLDTLSLLFQMTGFDVLDKRATMNDEFNVVIVRKRTTDNFKTVSDHRMLLGRSIEDTIIFHKEWGDKTAVWGSGAKGLCVLSRIDTHNLDMVVDSDVAKIGKYIPSVALMVQDPQEIIKQQVKAVIISAVTYQKSIVQKLKAMNYTGKIYLMTSSGLLETQ